jgi:hypothetical protein
VLAERRPPEQPADLSPDDDLGRLARRRDEIDQALAAWQPSLAVSPQAVRAYRALSAELASLTRTLVELRPRPEVEADRLEALGTTQRAALLARAREAALSDEGLRARVVAQAEAITRLTDALANGGAP